MNDHYRQVTTMADLTISMWRTQCNHSYRL